MSGPAPQPPGFRWTGRAYLLVGAGALLVASAVALRAPVALFIALPILVAPFAASAFVPRPAPSVAFSWEADGSGQDVRVAGTIRGRPAGTVANLLTRPSPPAGAAVVEPLRLELRGEELRFSTRWRLREPTMTFAEPPQVLWRDPLGLAEEPVDASAAGLSLHRFPAEVRRLRTLRLDRTIALPGETRSRYLGRSGEFHGIRDASPSEPWGRINWRASGRLGRLVANEYQTELTGDLVILLDERPGSEDRELEERVLGLGRAAAYGIADALLRSKVRVGYASFGEFLEAVPLSTGRGHRVRLLDAIARGRLASVAGPAERCANSLRRFFRPGLTTLVLSAWDGDPALGLVPYLRRQGFLPLLVSPSRLPMLERDGALPSEEEALARRLLRLDRRITLAGTWRFAPVVDWDSYWSLEGLVALLRGPTHRRVA